MLTCLPVKRSIIHLAEIGTANNPEKWRSKDEDSKERQSHTEKAHREAFDIVKSFIERFVILGKSVVKLNELGEIYV